MWEYNYLCHSDDYLMHYGVLGMKWGKHKAKQYSSNARYYKNSAKANSDLAKRYQKEGKVFKAAKYRDAAARDKLDYNINTSKAKDQKRKNAVKEKEAIAKRKAKREANKPNAKYNQNDRNTDKALYGESGVKRINKRMNEGLSHKQASRKEFKRQLSVGMTAIAGTTIATASYAAIQMNGGLKQAGRTAVESYLKAKGHTVIGWS